MRKRFQWARQWALIGTLTLACVACSSSEGGTEEAAPRGKFGEACESTCTDLRNARGAWDVTCINGPEYTGKLAACWTNDGLQCDHNLKSCQALIPVGSACWRAGCEQQAYCNCDGQPGCAPGSCAPLRGAGMPCIESAQCAANLSCSQGVCSG